MHFDLARNKNTMSLRSSAKHTQHIRETGGRRPYNIDKSSNTGPHYDFFFARETSRK
jgi:hypothetical protein